MNIKPMIAEYEVPGIENITALEKRHLVQVTIPGMEGNFLQNMGSEPVAISISGSLAGDEARDDFLKEIRKMYNAGEPVDFVADIITATEIEQVLIADLQISEVAGSPDSLLYAITLVQYIKPPSPAAADTGFGDLGDLNAALDLEAGDLFDLMEIPDLLGSIPNFGNPVPPLQKSVDGFTEAASGLSGTMQGLRNLFGVSEGDG